MPRVHYITYVTDAYGVGVTGAQVNVVGRSSATPVALYTYSTGTTQPATPITTLQGKAEFWVDDVVGYNITTSGTGFQDFTHYFDAVSAQTVNNLFLTVSGLVASLSTPIVYEAGTPIYGYAYLGDVGPAFQPGLSLAGDTKLYRAGVDTLQMPGTVKFGDGNNQTTAFQGYATPLVGIQVDNAKRASYATPIVGVQVDWAKRAEYATPLPGVSGDYAKRAEYATPLIGVSVDYAKRAEYATPLVGVSIDYAKRAEYATPVGVSTGSLAYLNQDESFTGLTTFTTPVRISASGTSLTVAGSIAGNTLSLVGGATLGANLGIGTTTPIFPLDVSGYGRFSTPIIATSSMVLIQAPTNLKIQASGSYWQVFLGNNAGPIKAGGLILTSSFSNNLPAIGGSQLQVDGQTSIGATPVAGINFNVLGKSSLWTATPIKDPALELVGLLTATPGIRFSDTNTQTIAFLGYATPVGVAAVSALAYINQNQTYTGLSSYSTPINIASAGAFPSLNVAGLITATPGVRFPDGTVQVTAFTTGGAFLGYATPLNTWSYTTPINVNANTTYTITHNLNSRAVTAQFYDTLNFEAVDPYVQRDTVNTLRVKFSQATPISTFQVVVKA